MASSHLVSPTSRPQSLPVLSQPLVTTMQAKGRRKSSRGRVISAQIEHSPVPESPAVTKRTNVLQAQLPRPETQTRHDDYTGLGEVCSIFELSENSYFANHKIHYVCKDPILGAVLVHAAVASGSIHGHVFSLAGSMAVQHLDTSSMSPHKRVSTYLSATQGSDSAFVSVAILIALYVSRIPEQRRTIIGERLITGPFEWNDQYAARIACALEQTNAGSTFTSLLAFLQPAKPRCIGIDMILAPDSSLHSLFPVAVPSKDRDQEHDKCPLPPLTENGDKRENIIHEILTTERTYVSRLKHLLDDYASPARTASRKGKGYLGSYETNTLFPTSLDAILLLNQDFLRALEGSDSDFEFASVLVKNFGDFRRVYARYLETSSDFEHILRVAMRSPRFKDFTDDVRAKHSAVIGIRELIMEPISRIPRYSLLISSLLAAITPANPAYSIFRQALAIVKRIGLMERDKFELSQEMLMKLSGVVSSWPTELVKSSVHILGMVDCIDVMPPFDYSANKNTYTEGNPASLVLLSDRIVLLKRGRGVRLEEILQTNKKGEIGYRGYLLLDSLSIVENDGYMYMFLRDEPFGVHSERWTARPMRKYNVPTSEANRFADLVRTAQADLKTSGDENRSERFEDCRINLAIYSGRTWKEETSTLRRPIRLWEDNDDGNAEALNLIISYDRESKTYECHSRYGARKNMVCKDVSQRIFKDALFNCLLDFQVTSWLSPPIFAEETIMDAFAMYALSQLSQAQTGSSPLKTRPKSPSKIVSSFLSRGTLSPPRSALLLSGSRSGTSFTSLSLGPSKKRSGQFFGFGTQDSSADKSLIGTLTFMESMRNFDEFVKSDFTPPTPAETKQINVLVASLTKDPRKGFAILGSPAKIAVQAFKAYNKLTLKKMNLTSVISEQTAKDLKSHLQEEPPIRRSRLKAVIIGIHGQNLSLLRSVLCYGQHVMSCISETCKIPFLLILSEMLVPPLLLTAFVATIEVILEDLDFIFFSFQEFDSGTINSLASGMSLQEPRFGSISSQSAYMSSPYNSSSHYQTATGTSPSLSRSPAKQSFNGTPDLVGGASSTDDAHSLPRSPSSSSIAPSLESLASKPYNRMSYHGGPQGFDNANIFGLTASESHLPLFQAEKDLPPPPPSFTDLSDSQERVTYDSRVMQNSKTREVSPARSFLPTIEAPFVSEDLGMARGVVLSHSTSGDSLSNKLLAATRKITPSRIPILSPNCNLTSPAGTPTHSRTPSTVLPMTTIPLTLSSRKESSIPRMPSSFHRVDPKSSSTYPIQLDSELSASLDIALRFASNSQLLDSENLIASPILQGPSSPKVTKKALTTAAEATPVAMAALDKDISINTPDDALPLPELIQDVPRSISREFMRREIYDSGITASDTIHRMSRQLHETTGAMRSRARIARSSSPQYQKQTTRCDGNCIDKISLLELELTRYKDLYRNSCEEVDVTLDLANEQIATLSESYAAGTLEKTALGLLELEKEKVRKLKLEVMALKTRAKD